MGRTAIRIVGCAKRLLRLLSLVPPVVLLLERVRALPTGIPGRRVLRNTGLTTRGRWRRIPRVVGHIAAGLFLLWFDIMDNGGRTLKVA